METPTPPDHKPKRTNAKTLRISAETYRELTTEIERVGLNVEQVLPALVNDFADTTIANLRDMEDNHALQAINQTRVSS